MIKHLPEWIMQRYAKLWEKFRDNDFSREDAEKILKKDNSLAVFLSDLRKAGWIEMKMDQQDARKSIYKLKNPNEAIISQVKGNMGIKLSLPTTYDLNLGEISYKFRERDKKKGRRNFIFITKEEKKKM